DQIVFDLIYTPLQTTLLRDAAAAGATAIGGLEMLLHQGARSFEIWTGQRMPLDQIRPLVTEALQSRTH
ncbi:MAG: shikimate dehydrogenase, partial [Bacteroidota bacterium]